MMTSDYRSRFIQIYHDFSRPVRRILYRMQGAEELDDLVQEVFLRAWKGLPNYNELSSLKTWIYRIAVNLSLDTRKKGKLKLVEQKNLIEAFAKTEIDVDANRSLIHKALQTLSLDNRLLVVLYYFEEQTLEEIAEILKVPSGTLKSRLFSVRKQLMDFLVEKGVFHERFAS